jgi:hypothetical protein
MRTAIIVLISTLSAIAQSSDIKFVVREKISAANQSDTEMLTTYYVHGVMRRKGGVNTSLPQVSTVTIADCASGTGYLIDPQKREYRRFRTPKYHSEAELQKFTESEMQVRSETSGTGEARSFFGHPAQHFITKITLTSLKGSPNVIEEQTIDGWYLDVVVPDSNCTPQNIAAEPRYRFGLLTNTYPKLPSWQHTGPVPMGLAVLQQRTKVSNGKKEISATRVVEDFSETPLDPSLFELPKGFRENPSLLR